MVSFFSALPSCALLLLFRVSFPSLTLACYSTTAGFGNYSIDRFIVSAYRINGHQLSELASVAVAVASSKLSG